MSRQQIAAHMGMIVTSNIAREWRRDILLSQWSEYCARYIWEDVLPWTDVMVAGLLFWWGLDAGGEWLMRRR